MVHFGLSSQRVGPTDHGGRAGPDYGERPPGARLERRGRARRACNPFTPDTGVLMADGSVKPIGVVQVGDLVAATDPVTGVTTAQPVVDLLTGYGDKHLVEFRLDGAAAPIVATADHPVWVGAAAGSTPRTWRRATSPAPPAAPRSPCGRSATSGCSRAGWS